MEREELIEKIGEEVIKIHFIMNERNHIMRTAEFNKLIERLVDLVIKLNK